MATATTVAPVRIQRAFTAKIEKRILHAIARRLPLWVNSDHLTLLGLFGQILGGAFYAAARYDRWWLLAVCAALAVNWFGDSLDGTLARVRNRQRPRYGHYVDHVCDLFGTAALLCGMTASGYVHWQVAMAMLITFYLLSAESFLAANTVGRFEMSFAAMGPTELRLLLCTGNLVLLVHPYSTLWGHRWLLFDVGGVIGCIGMVTVCGVAVGRHTGELYRLERLP